MQPLDVSPKGMTMRNTKKMAMAALMALALIPAGASASYTVKGPFPGTVTATTYYSSGAFHGAVDIAGTCNYWGVLAPVIASIFWDVTIRSTGTVCSGSSPSGSQNEIRHTFSNGWTFRLQNFLQTSDSYDRTCSNCIIGKTSALASHLQYDSLGTLDTSWYSGYTVRGEAVDTTETVGVLN
jgi:hypothetical protein